MTITFIILYDIFTYNLSWLELFLLLVLVCYVEGTSFDDLSYQFLLLRFIWICSNYGCRFIILFTLALSYTAICSCFGGSSGDSTTASWGRSQYRWSWRSKFMMIIICAHDLSFLIILVLVCVHLVIFNLTLHYLVMLYCISYFIIFLYSIVLYGISLK